VRGAATLGWAPGRPMTVLVENPDGDPLPITTQTSTDERGATTQVFSAALDPTWRGRALSTCVLLPDGSRAALDPPAPREPAGGAVAGRRLDRPRRPTPKTSIIVPVYAGVDDTMTCLGSVLGTTGPDLTELIVVYDAGPEPELLAALRGLADQGRITLLVNDRNLGYPGAVNRGMALRPEQDVVLLNSDAEVFGDWLERLTRAAYADRNIATVTPFANNASILSYPVSEDFICDGPTARALDALFAENAGPVVDLPTGVGHCLYIKRACLAEIGDFEDQAFGKGYGEENDFCLRAAAAGWRNVAAPNLFVRHIGGRSFGALKELLMETNLRVLNRLHPGYEALVTRFVDDDPLGDVRGRVDRRRLVADPRPTVLVITTARGGGVGHHVAARVRELEADGYRVAQLRPADEQWSEGRCRLLVGGDPALEIPFRLPGDLSALSDLLGRLAIERAEIHHFLGLDPTAIDLPRALDIPFDVVVHDYGWICPRLTLIQPEQGYCGEPAAAECERCVALHGSLIEEDISVADLRARGARLFEAAASVTVPSGDVATRLRRYFPGLAPRITPWETVQRGLPPSPALSPGRARVAVIGAIGEHKGYRHILACARDAARRDLPIDFVVIGYTEDDPPLFETGRAFVTGPFHDSEVAGLIEREGCNVALFASIAPETWSYTLSHGLRSGLPIVAFDVGAIGERLRGQDRAWLLPVDCGPAALNDALIAAASPQVRIGLRARGGDDVLVTGETWARPANAGAWIEGLRVEPPEIQSMALLAGGGASPWTSAPAWCADPSGSRPLIGFALKAGGPLGEAYECHYEGTFSSGAIVASRREGDICRSSLPNDPLVGLCVRLAPRRLDAKGGFH